MGSPSYGELLGAAYLASKASDTATGALLARAAGELRVNATPAPAAVQQAGAKYIERARKAWPWTAGLTGPTAPKGRWDARATVELDRLRRKVLPLGTPQQQSDLGRAMVTLAKVIEAAPTYKPKMFGKAETCLTHPHDRAWPAAPRWRKACSTAVNMARQAAESVAVLADKIRKGESEVMVSLASELRTWLEEAKAYKPKLFPDLPDDHPWNLRDEAQKIARGAKAAAASGQNFLMWAAIAALAVKAAEGK